jgi:peptidoglycan/xylan/chitin deacetylase (PgdA/CDA1 family)
MKELHPYLIGKKKGRVVGITFDDGYRNNLECAAPVLKKYGFSATCYIVSDKVGKTNEWDLEQGIPQKALMSEEEVLLWIKEGMDIGCHTRNHVDLSAVNNELAVYEIKQSKIDLEDRFHIDITDFCYPFGGYNLLSTVELVKEAGFLTATTMKRGRSSMVSSLLELPRIPVTHHTLPHLFIMKILSNYEDRRG